MASKGASNGGPGAEIFLGSSPPFWKEEKRKALEALTAATRKLPLQKKQKDKEAAELAVKVARINLHRYEILVQFAGGDIPELKEKELMVDLVGLETELAELAQGKGRKAAN